MTYQQLADAIAKLTPEQKNLDVTVSLDYTEAAVPAKELLIIEKDDFLENALGLNHPVVTVNY